MTKRILFVLLIVAIALSMVACSLNATRNGALSAELSNGDVGGEGDMGGGAIDEGGDGGWGSAG
ncbi:MAG: hypothetical protein J5755_02900, partial [Clostridia bacterium]|nr:hypothetical protein [Clostridia bacterium]